MPLFSSTTDFDTMVTGNSDGPFQQAPFTLGRHNKWGYLCIWGPATGVGKPLNLGLIQTFSVQETNDSSFLPQAGSDWLELQIGSRMWRGSCARYHVRGADMKQMVRRLYPKAQDVDFRYMPFVIAYFFDYAPPNGISVGTYTGGYEAVTWVFHKVIITDYTNDLITGPNRLLEERFNFISAGEEFQDMNQNSGAGNYRSTPAVWRGDYYGWNSADGPTSDQSGGNKFNFPSAAAPSGAPTAPNNQSGVGALMGGSGSVIGGPA
jgi:hypothetical protein